MPGTGRETAAPHDLGESSQEAELLGALASVGVGIEGGGREDGREPAEEAYGRVLGEIAGVAGPAGLGDELQGEQREDVAERGDVEGGGVSGDLDQVG